MDVVFRIMPSEMPISWWRQLGRRMAALAPLKSVGIPGFMALYFAIYLPVLHNPLFEVTEVPLTVVDRMIGVQPWALPAYLSLWVYASLAPGMIAERKELVLYGVAAAVLSAVGFVFFLLWPTAVPTGGCDWSVSPALASLKDSDQPGNACPSMHVAFALFSACWIGRCLRQIGAPRLWRVVNWVWCAAIVYSTLATKQHVFFDVLAGLVCGGVAAWSHFRVAARAGQSIAAVPVQQLDSCG